MNKGWLVPAQISAQVLLLKLIIIKLEPQSFFVIVMTNFLSQAARIFGITGREIGKLCRSAKAASAAQLQIKFIEFFEQMKSMAKRKYLHTKYI